MRLPKNLLSGGYKQPEVFLCQVDKSIIGGLNVTNFSGRFKFNSYDEITFDVDRTYIDHNGEYCVNPLYDYIESPRVIYVVNFGYFEIIQSGIVTDGLREYKQCVCYSYEFILSTKYLDLFTINMGTVESINGVQLYSTADVSKSLIHLVLEKTNGAWTPGHVDINLQTRQRSFEINHESIYDFLINDVSDTFKCVFDFDTVNNVVNIYDEETYGQPSGVYINKDNLAQNIEIDYNGDEIKTCLYVYGDSDLDIRAVNMGLPHIMNLDYYFSESWMGKDLYDAYYAYCKKVESKKPEYDALLEQLYTCYDEYSALYNNVPEYYEDNDIPTVNSKDKLPTPSEENVYEIYKVLDGDNANYYICKPNLIDGKTVYLWVIDIDANISSYLVLPTPSVEYANIVVKIPNESNGTSYYICKVSEPPSDENNWTTTYGWIPASNKEGIKLLKEKEQCYLDIQSVHVAAGWAEQGNANYSRYEANYEKLIDIQQKITAEEAKAINIEKEIETIEANMGKISSALQLNETNFSQEQIIKLNSFIREDEYTDSNFLITEHSDDNDILETKRQLKEAAEKELKKISQPQLSFKMDMANLLAIPEFEPILNNFQLGNSVMVEIRPKYVVKTQLLEAEIGFDMLDFSATFGNLTCLTSQIDVHAALMSQAVSAGKSVAESGSYWKKGADTATSINSRIERGLIDAVTSLKTDSINQAISYDNRGIHLRRYKNEDKTEYENEQVWLNNEKIVFTDDNWKTAKMALGKIAGPTSGEEVYGIIAPNIVGTLLAGENLVIDSVKGDGSLSSFRVDSNGARLYNSTFLMEKEIEYIDENNNKQTKVGQIMIDPKYGIVAGNGIYTTNNDGTIIPQFVDNENNSIIKENDIPLNSNFFLDIESGSAYFRGIVYAQDGIFEGKLSGATGDFAGTVTAGDGAIGGWIIKDGYLHSGSNKTYVGLSSSKRHQSTDEDGNVVTTSTDYAIWAGGENPNDATNPAPFRVKRDGTIYAKSGVFEKDVVFKGKLSGATGTFNGSLNIGAQTDEDGKISGYNFIVNEDGSVIMNGGITLGGTIAWSSDSSPMRTLYAEDEEDTPTKHYDKYNNNSSSTWHKVCSEDDLYVSYSYDGGNTWTIAQPIAKVPSYIKSTYIDFSSVNAPFLRGNNISMFDGRFKVFKTKEGMLWDGTKEEIEDESTELGFIGYGKGNNSLADTEGVVLSSVGASDYACGANYVIVTDSGVRMQSGWHSLYVTSTGCYQSVYDPESMEENPVRIGVCVFAE